MCRCLDLGKWSFHFTSSSERISIHNQRPERHLYIALMSLDSFQEKRLEQILKLDANALLATIRDLEQKLSSYQRYDRPPPWFNTLEQRLEQIEKWQQSFPSAPSVTEIRVSEGLSSKEGDGEGVGGALSASSMLQNEHGLALLEQKILSKVKTDLALKMENLSLQIQDQLLNTSLEMDRLQKLLIIRPTTSELQQIILNVQTVEENASKQIQSIYHTLQTKIKDSVSTEMVTLLDELKSHQQHSNDKMDSISKLMSSYAMELQELQNNEQKSFRLFEEIVSSQQKENQRSSEQLQSLISDEIQQKFAASQSSVEKLTEDLRLLQSSTSDDKEQLAVQLSFLDEKMTNDSLKIRNELHDMNDSLQATSSQLYHMEGDLRLLSDNFNLETTDWKAYRHHLDELLLQQKLSIKELQNGLTELRDFGILARLPRCEDSIAKVAQEVVNLQSTVTSIMNQDLRSLSERCLTLEEQVNTVLPKLLQLESIRINAILKDIDVIQANQITFNNRLSDDEELINNLLPVTQKIKNLSEKVDKFEADVFSFKSLVESSIDANTEIIRRIEEMEEKFESLDDVITHRMNAIRDTLMDTLLEKQYETSSALKTVKDNLEVMSAAGEASLPTAAPVAKLSRMSSSTGKNFLTDNNDSSTPLLRGAVTSVVAMPKRQSSYRRPTISGAMVHGSSIAGEGGIGVTGSSVSHNNVSGSAGIADNRSLYMTDSFSTGPASPRTLSGDDMHSVNSSMTKGALHISKPPMHSHHKTNNSTPLLPPTAGSVRGALIKKETVPQTQQQPENDDVDQNSAFDDEVFNHFMDNYEKDTTTQPHLQPDPTTLLPAPRRSDMSTNDVGSVMTQLSDTPSQHTTGVSVTSHLPRQVGRASIKQAKRVTSASSSKPIPSSSSMVSTAVTSSPPQTRSELLSVEYSRLLNESHTSAVNTNIVHFHEVQMLADLCLNYEDISTKKKRLSSLPPVLCHTVIDVTQRLAEEIANASDFDMVEMVLTKIMDENILNLSEVQYDETFVITRRQQKVSQVLAGISQLVGHYYTTQHQPAITQMGVVRTDARQLFFTLVKKALELFLTKHNQVS